MKTYLFVNPLSGHYSSSHFQSVLSRLQRFGITPEVFRVHTPTEIASHCALINQNVENPLVIVAGGDGTFNAVINGLDHGIATMAVLPFGTSNVLAAEIGIKSIDDSLERIAVGKTDSLSLGVLELEGRSLRFVLMAGIGVDGAVVRDVWPSGKRFLRQGAYVLSALKRLITWDSTLFEISSSEVDVTCHSAIICNASRYGGNITLSPGSSPFLPGLSAVCITGNKRSTYLSNAIDLVLERGGTGKAMIRVHSSCFDIRGRHPIQIDGDFVGYGPARVSELADFARIIV